VADQIEAVGYVASGVVASAPVQIDVERQDSPKYIFTDPAFLTFLSIGDKLRIDVQGIYPSFGPLSVTNSTLTTYLSNNTQVVTVAPNGFVTAVGPGQTTVLVQHGSLSTTFEVTVAQPRVSGPSPVIDSVTPATGTPSQTHVTLAGSNFGASQSDGFVQLGTLNAVVSSWSDTQIVATVASKHHFAIADLRSGGNVRDNYRS
jgi:hypothetical protein